MGYLFINELLQFLHRVSQSSLKNHITDLVSSVPSVQLMQVVIQELHGLGLPKKSNEIQATCRISKTHQMNIAYTYIHTFYIYIYTYIHMCIYRGWDMQFSK